MTDETKTNDVESPDDKQARCSSPAVKIGQLWKRRNGVVYEVTEERDSHGARDVLLVPVDTPAGVRSRRTWKWDQAVRAELSFVPDTPE